VGNFRRVEVPLTGWQVPSTRRKCPWQAVTENEESSGQRGTPKYTTKNKAVHFSRKVPNTHLVSN
jgi:hypothetical protein